MRQVIDAELQKAQSGAAATAAANQTPQISNQTTNANQTSSPANGGAKNEAANSIEKK